MWYFEQHLRPDTGFLNNPSLEHPFSHPLRLGDVARPQRSHPRPQLHLPPSNPGPFPPRFPRHPLCLFRLDLDRPTPPQHGENTLFPALEDFTKQPGIMEGNMQQHEAFLPALHTFRDYVQNTCAEEYSSESIKALVDSFAPALTEHLRQEMDTLLGLDCYDSAKLMRIWTVTENVAKGATHPNQFVSDLSLTLTLSLSLSCVSYMYQTPVQRRFHLPPPPFPS
jgi:hypothetical protein